MPIEEAMEQMLSPIKPIQTTLQLPLAEAIGYVLAEDILSLFSFRLLITQQWTDTQFVLPT